MLAGVARWKWVALLIAVALLVVALVTSGGSTAAVANVNGRQITLASYQTWLSTAASSLHAADGVVPNFVPDAPGYNRCISYIQAYTRTHEKKSTSRTAARSECSGLRAVLAEDVMEMLISGSWYMQQGAREHVQVSASAVNKALHGSFPKSGDLLHFLGTEGMTRSQLQYEAKAGLIAQKLTARHSGPTPTITATQIANYYNQNRSSIGNETLAKATPAIRAALISQAQAPTLDAYLARVQSYYLARTSCARGYRIAGYCRA